MSFASRMGLKTSPDIYRLLQERLTETRSRVTADLVRSGEMLEQELPELVLPDNLISVIEAAVSLEREEAGGVSLSNRAEQILRHYTDWMPSMFLVQQGSMKEPEHTIFHTQLDWDALPRLRSGMNGLFQLLEKSGVRAENVIGYPSMSALMAQEHTLSELFLKTHYGQCMPLLYTYPADMAAYHRELDSGAGPFELIDRRLASPLVHEFAHFGRNRHVLYPPIIDECIAGYLGIYLLPEFAYPDKDQDNALFGSPWFAQIGQAFIQCFGLREVVRAQTGSVSWEEILPEGLIQAMERLGWHQYVVERDPSFLSGNTRPDPWMKLFYLARAGRLGVVDSFSALSELSFDEIPVEGEGALDGMILRDGLKAMCLEARLVGGCYRVRTRVPEVPIQVDLEQCRFERARQDDDAGQNNPAYLFPPSIASRWRRAGYSCGTLKMERLEEIEPLVTGFLEGEFSPEVRENICWD